MAWTIARQDDGMLKYTETPGAVSAGTPGYSSDIPLNGADSIQFLVDEVTNSTVTLEYAKYGAGITVGGIGADPSASGSQTQSWVAASDTDIADNALDLKLVNSDKARLKITSASGDVTQALAFYVRGTDSSDGFSISGSVGADPS